VTPVLVLVGPPGAGKTSVGELVASRAGLGFRDTDRDVEATAGASVADLFVEQGEEAFRELEVEAVARALAEHAGVLALGGGAVLDQRSRERLASVEPVVFLDVGLADAASRVGLNRDRPLLLGNPRAQLKALLDARRPVYEQVATVVIDTTGRDVDAVADDVAALL
jgi:shikimate kinase